MLVETYQDHWRIKGVPGTRASTPPPAGPNSFIFMQFSAKDCKVTPTLELAPPSQENPGSATEDGIVTELFCSQFCLQLIAESFLFKCHHGELGIFHVVPKSEKCGLVCNVLAYNSVGVVHRL